MAWGRRSIRRLFFGIGFMLALIITGGMLIESSVVLGIICMSIAFLSPITLPTYFKLKENSGKKKCEAVIKRDYSESPTYTIEAWHPYSEWGYLTLTDKSIVFIPKKGEMFHRYLGDLNYYAFDYMGTGEYITTTSNIANTNLSVSGTREAKVAVFYIIDGNNEKTYWEARKNKKFFTRTEKAFGVDRKNIKANF